MNDFDYFFDPERLKKLWGKYKNEPDQNSPMSLSVTLQTFEQLEKMIYSEIGGKSQILNRFLEEAKSILKSEENQDLPKSELLKNREKLKEILVQIEELLDIFLLAK